MTKTTCFDHIGCNARFRMFSVKYIHPANVRGSRVHIKDLRRNKSKFISFDETQRDIGDMALNYLLSIGISVDAMGLANKDSDCVLLSLDIFTPLK